jgi:hypothetical protein
MVIQLQSGIRITNPEEIIHSYYETMGKGVHKYDGTKLPEDDSFSEGQIDEAIRLANGLGASIRRRREVARQLVQRRSDIECRLAHVPSHVRISDGCNEIPWKELEAVFDIFRVRYLGLTGMTKILHKKRPNIIPILDKIIASKYLKPLLAKQEITNIQRETEAAVYYIKIRKRDVDRNRHSLMELQRWITEQLKYDISILRVLDILIWSCFGPFRGRVCGQNLLIS